MITGTSEDLALQSLLPELRAEGYEVLVKPRKSVLPEFFRGFQPDAVALRSDGNLAIEVKHDKKTNSATSKNVADLFQGQSDWKLRIIWLSSGNEIGNPARQSLDQIGDRLTEIEKLVAGGHHQAAFLLGWAVLEAFARASVDKDFDRPQTPGRIVERLAEQGVLTPSEADSVRSLVDKRNRLIHGELNVAVSEADTRQFTSILRTLISGNRH